MIQAPTYAAPCQAAADAERLHEGPPPPPPLLTLREHLRMVVGDPRANSDVLLIQADALRTTAQWAAIVAPSYAEALTRWANTLTDLAPSRANPIEAP